ncbi:hypothetical protein NPIL_131571 [Nephila pilipes]|uniref:Uncharacterized protein n=1 Tax=Nephila pilipes TaxID=299642 RepID=A0A8X6QN38_NEPPI|nr:hypothetical protein NPIL_131571 [Nephila pilipes]
MMVKQAIGAKALVIYTSSKILVSPNSIKNLVKCNQNHSINHLTRSDIRLSDHTVQLSLLNIGLHCSRPIRFCCCRHITLLYACSGQVNITIEPLRSGNVLPD